MTDPDLDQQIRRLIDAGSPVTLDEVINRSRQPTRSKRRIGRREQIFPLLVAALVAAAVLVAVTTTGHRHHTQNVSMATDPSTAILAPPTTAAPVPSTVGTSTPPLPGCFLDSSTPTTTPPTSYVTNDFWQCPATPAQGQEVTGAPIPDPTVPAGYVPAYQPIIYAAPGPLANAVYQRAWTPPGTFSAAGATGSFIELRVRAHQPNGWNIGYTHTVDLTNGVQATATFSLTPKTYPGTPSNTSDDRSNGITWSNAGLDYDLQVNGISPQEILTVANSLP